MSVVNLDVSPKALDPVARARQLGHGLVALLDRIPHSANALLARLGIAVTFWASGQTKIEGLVLDPIGGHVQLGIPHVSESAIELFRSEYALPLLPPELAAHLAAAAEHVFPLLIILGLATRLSAFALLMMTLVIQLFVYPSAYPTHALWGAALLYLMARGPGALSMDRILANRHPAQKIGLA